MIPLSNQPRFCAHRSYTKIPTSAVDRVDTALNGCRPRIKAYNQVITVNDTNDIGCQLSSYGCQWTRVDSRFCMYGI